MSDPVNLSRTQPQFPIYIPSKGRWESRLTVKALDSMGVPYYVIVEDQEYNNYAAVIDKKKIIVLDRAYQREYETFDDFGDTKIYGGGPARNMGWDHAIANGFEWHWTMDDNIHHFQRLNRNLKIRVGDGTVIRCMEDFVLRYRNIGMAGPQYDYFAPRKKKWPAFVTNTRIYSCNFIRCSLPFRWRGRMNEDTDLSLQVLKANWCTVQFNAFLQKKITTQVVKGGNTEQYKRDGTLFKSTWLVERHPDVTRMMHRFGRAHHYVDYRQFRKNKLVLRDDVEIVDGVDDYGMRVVQHAEA